MAASSVDEARQIVAGIGGGTSLKRGEEIHRFVKEHRFERCLELGFAYGVSSVWIGSALEGNGFGTLTSVDILAAHQRQPTARETLERAGLDSIAWSSCTRRMRHLRYLQRVLRQQLRDGRIEPVFDFVFLDGAHTWDADGLAFLLVDRLLKPGGVDPSRRPGMEARRRALPRCAACSTGTGAHPRGLGSVGAAGFELRRDEHGWALGLGEEIADPHARGADRRQARPDRLRPGVGGSRDPSSAAKQGEAGRRRSRRPIR